MFVRFLMIALFLTRAAFAQMPSGNEKKESYSYVIMVGKNSTWGYDIYREKKLIIRQPTIPGQPGDHGFATKEAASRVAELVIEKIERGEARPTVTKEELQKLNVL